MPSGARIHTADVLAGPPRPQQGPGLKNEGHAGAPEAAHLGADGYSSSLAASLRALGLHNATDLAGGFQARRAAGLPVTNPAHPSRRQPPQPAPATQPQATRRRPRP